MQAQDPIHEKGLEIDLISGARVADRLAITEQQIELLTACVIGGEDANRAFNQSFTIEFSGHLNIQALKSSLHDLIARNDSFRMVFDIASKQSLVLASVPVVLEEKRLALSVDPEVYLKEQLQKGANVSFDIRKGPLVRFSLLSGGDVQHYLTIEAHHVVCDGWTLSLIIEELATLYNAYADDKKPQLEPPVSYRKFVESEKELHASQAYLETCDYWKEVYKNYKPVPSLPYDKPRPSEFSYASSHISYPLKDDIFSKVRQLSDQADCSILIAMAATFEVLLHRKTASRNLVIGFPTAGQAPAGLERLMGHCVNTLPVLAHVDDKVNFIDYLKNRKKEFHKAFSNRRVTFGNILKHLNIDRGQTSLPFVPVTFNVDRALLNEDAFSGLKSGLRVNPRHFSSFDMIINVSRVKEKLVIECDYNKALFDDANMSELLRQYEYLLGNLSQNPDQAIGVCDLYDLNQIKQRMADFNHTAADYPRHIGVIGLIRQQALLNADKTALGFEQSRISYSELVAEVEKRAKAIRGAGLKEGEFAGIMLNRSPEMLYQMLAVMQAGLAYIPIDPEFPLDRIRYMLEDSGARLLICEDEYKSIGEHLCMTLTPKELLTFYSEKTELNAINPESSAYILYTSGSTGRPKGVQMSHGSLINLLCSMQSVPGFTANDSLLALTTISFDISGLELYLPLISGAKLVLASSKVSKRGEDILDIIKDEDITVIQATPATFRLILGYGFEGKKNLRIFCGGEPLSLELARDLLPKCKELWNLYGPTETCIWSCVNRIGNDVRQISIGGPIANTDIYLLDERHRPVPPGSHGEIAIAGDGLAIGYLNRPELTNDKFIPHPFDANRKIYLTGDLGYIGADGQLYCLGRTDHQIKVRGYRIETGEIENVLIKEAGYKEAVVIAKNFGKDDVRIIAFLKSVGVSQRNFKTDKTTGLQLDVLQKAESDALREMCAKLLPEYMIPALFVAINAMPLTPNAKTDRKLLSEIETSSLLENASKQQRQAGCLDSNYWNPTELKIKPLWESALGIKNAGKRDDFFASGGHSLIAIDLMHDIEMHLKVRLPLSALFKKPSIEGLAQIIDGEDKQEYKCLVPIKASGSGVPLYIIHGAGLEVMVFKDLVEHMDMDQPVIAVQAIGLNSDEMPPDSLEEIAAVYVKEIRQHNRSGTFLIAGFSAGSLLAYEVCRQLEAAGEKVALCGIFDYSLETTRVNRTFAQKIQKSVTEFLPRLWYATRMFFKNFRKALPYQMTFLKLRVNGILGRIGFDVEEKVEPDGRMERMFKLMDHYYEALSSYQVKPYNGKIDLFRSKIKLYYLKDRKNLGWAPYVAKGISIHEVEGDHDHMILGENSKGFAQKLQTAINTALKNGVTA